MATVERTMTREIGRLGAMAGAKSKSISPMKRADMLWAYLMIAPLMIGLLVFYIWPVFQNFYFSFTTWGAFGTYSWSGTSNYERLAHDPDLGAALRNTLLYIIISVPVSIILSIIVAVLLNQKIRGVGVYRTLYFLPAVTMPAAIAIVWQWIYNGDYGLLNGVLRIFGIRGPHWIADPRMALYAATAVAVWSSIGNTMVLFLAGLQAIPKMYYEAASLDGAGRVRLFLHVTLPLLSPTIFFTSVIALINGFQVFDLIFLMFGPSSPVIESTETVVYLFYKNAFLIDNKGYAAAIAMLLFAIILVATFLQFRMQRRWVHYA